jgi:hypothetical protein
MHKWNTIFDCGPRDLRRVEGTSFRGRSRRGRSAPIRHGRARAGPGTVLPHIWLGHFIGGLEPRCRALTQLRLQHVRQDLLQ